MDFRGKNKGAVVSTRAADSYVARETPRILEYLGIAWDVFEDCCLVGLWQLNGGLETIYGENAVIAVAGLDAATVSAMGDDAQTDLWRADIREV